MSIEDKSDLTVYTRKGKLRKKRKDGQPIFINSDKPTTMSKPVSIRIDLQLLDFVKSKGSLSKYVNELIRKDYESSK